METCPKVTFISIRHLPVQIKIHKENIRTKCDASEEYSELCQTSKMKLFAKTLNGFQLLTIVFTVKTFDTYAYSKPSQTSKMKLFPKIINSFQPLAICALNTQLVKVLKKQHDNKVMSVFFQILPQLFIFILLCIFIQMFLLLFEQVNVG